MEIMKSQLGFLFMSLVLGWGNFEIQAFEKKAAILFSMIFRVYIICQLFKVKCISLATLKSSDFCNQNKRSLRKMSSSSKPWQNLHFTIFMFHHWLKLVTRAYNIKWSQLAKQHILLTGPASQTEDKAQRKFLSYFKAILSCFSEAVALSSKSDR